MYIYTYVYESNKYLIPNELHLIVVILVVAECIPLSLRMAEVCKQTL